MGFPTLKKITRVLAGDERIVFLAVQTVFEGHDFNTRAKVRQDQLKYQLKIPMAHAPGDPDTDPVPAIMRDYRSGGTPWTVIIDPAGIVVYNDFHIQADQAVALIEKLLQHPTADKQ